MIVDCCVRNDAQSHVRIERFGDLIRLTARNTTVELLFLPEDFAKLCKTGLEFAAHCGWKDPEEDDLK